MPVASDRSAAAAPAAPAPSAGRGCQRRSAPPPDRRPGRSPAAAVRRSPSSTGRSARLLRRPALPRRCRKAQRDRLRDRLAGRQHVGPGQLQRPAVGLVGGVGPVALVLHLERVALHPALARGGPGAMMGDRADRLERLPGVDQVGKPGLATVPSTCSTVTGAPATPTIGCSMQKPQRLVSKSPSGTAVARKRAGRPPCPRSAPRMRKPLRRRDQHIRRRS